MRIPFRTLAHVPEKWMPVFRKGHAQKQESRPHLDPFRSGCVLALASSIAVCMSFGPIARASADEMDGVVRVKSAYGMEETVARLKQDVAGKGIMFFSEINQSELAAKAGVKLRPSTLLVFGNPPLGTLFLTSNPDAGLDWPVRLWSTRTMPAMSGRSTPILPGSRAVTTSPIATTPSRWRPW